MRFSTHIAGIPCKCDVTYFSPPVPMKVTGPGYADCSPPEEEIFEYRILDRKGYPAAWLEKKIDLETDARLYEEFLIHRGSENYGYYDHED